MAEFPELGHHCSLPACGRLDFTPYQCDDCHLFFCGAHRLKHGCSGSAVQKSSEPSSSGLPRNFLCAFESCHETVLVRIDCQHCSQCFCLQHRFPEAHKCRHSPKKTLGEIHQMWIRQSAKPDDKRGRDHPISSTVNIAGPKVLDNEEQKRADRIAVMRLKSNAKNHEIPPGELLFLFVVDDFKRDAVMVSKKWTVGRCVDHIAREMGIQNNNAVQGAQMLRMYAATRQSEPIPMGDIVEQHLADMSSVCLKLDS